MKKILVVFSITMLMTGCKTVNYGAVPNSVIFGGEPSFVHDPVKMVEKEINRKARKEIDRVREKLNNMHQSE